VSTIPDLDVNSLIAELQQISTLVKDIDESKVLENPSPELQAAFKRLDEIAALEVTEKFTNEVLKTPKFNFLLPAISNFRFLYNLKLEIEEAKNLILSKKPWEILENFTFYPNYLQLARTEYTGAELKPGNCVLFLGSGPLPLSLIVLCNEYNLFGTGIEKERKRADISRKVIDNLGLSKRIQIIEGNHFDLPLQTKYDLCMIAAQAEPKKEIFEYLAKVLPSESKVSYRLYEKGLRKLLDSSFYFEPPAEFEEDLRVQPLPPVNNTVIFLKRK
jgi:hypothetical protein